MRIRVARILHRIAWMLLVFAFLIVFRILACGIPERWIARAEKALSSEETAVEIDDVTFSFHEGLHVDRLRLFPKNMSTDPMITVSGITVEFSPASITPSPGWIRNISADDVILAYLPKHSGEASAPLRRFDSLSVKCGAANILGTKMRGLSMSVSSSGNALNIDDLKVDFSQPRSPSEPVEGEFSFGITDNSIHGAAVGTMTPAALLPLFRAVGMKDVPEIIEWFDFNSGPAQLRAKIDIEANGAGNRADVAITADSCVFRGVPFLSVRGKVTASGTNGWQIVKVSQLSAERPEGSGRGELLFDSTVHGVYLSGTSTIDPKHLSSMLGIFTRDELKHYNFGSASEITAQGYYGFSKSVLPTSIDGVAKVQTARVFGTRVDNLRTEFSISDGRYLFPRISASLSGGACSGSALLKRDKDKGILFSADLSVHDAQVAPLASRIAGKQMDDNSTFSAVAQLEGNLTTNILASLSGDGSCQVRGATVYKMPLFAGFTDFMARTVPGVDFLVSQNDLDMKFTIGGNGMHFSKLQIEGKVFSISGDGDYWFSDYLDIGVKVSLLKRRTLAGCAMRWILMPVSKLFELEATGPVNNAKWSPTTLKLRGRSKPTDAQKGISAEADGSASTERHPAAAE